MIEEQIHKSAIAVYCASSTPKQKAHINAAICALNGHGGCRVFRVHENSSIVLGRAFAREKRPLVYGGGSSGLMGVVSRTVLDGGGSAIGIVPYAMHISGGETEKTKPSNTIEQNQNINHPNVRLFGQLNSSFTVN
jgi:predicted Rossmann-fold nucleotide-binding protein